ncbi:MAG: crossover junction endodeoxyribonuclease RuvC [Thermodesulfobacteriota bacterium]
MPSDEGTRHATTVIGIDPGIAATGMAVVQGRGFHVVSYHWEVVHTSPPASQGERLEIIYRAASALFHRYRPDLAVVEDVFLLDATPKSAFSISTVIGILLLVAAQSQVPVDRISVREAKQVLTGNGKASKDQLERAVRSVLGLSRPVKPDHASDALGLALIGLLRSDNPLRRQAVAC